MKLDVEVLARNRWNDTSLDVQQGQIVSVSAQGSWTDAGIRCAPDGFERPWLNPVGWMRRESKSPWFCLIAAVGQVKRPLYQIGGKAAFVSPSDGRLYLFANDAWMFYFNNSGAVNASIEVSDV